MPNGADGVPGVPDHVSVPLLWIGPEEVPILYINNFYGQVEQQEVIVTFGQVAPPYLRGDTPEERLAQAQGMGYVQVRPAARFAFSRARLVELMNVLAETLKNYDDLQRRLEDEGG